MDTFVHGTNGNRLLLTSVSITLEFFQNGVEKGVVVSTFRMQIAALSVFFVFFFCFFFKARLANELLVKQFLMARERITPVTKESFPPWDLTRVFKGFIKTPIQSNRGGFS